MLKTSYPVTNEKPDSFTKPRLVIPVGDPAGIGPEVVLKALADINLTQQGEMTIIGNYKILQQTYFQLKQQGVSVLDPQDVNILETSVSENLSLIKPGMGNAESGAASFAYLQEAIARTLGGEFHGIVTGPIAKHHWKEAGYHYPGQTELLAEKAGVKRFGMLFVARSPHQNWTLRTLLATTHIPLSQVSQVLTPELLTLKLELLIDCLQDDFGLTNPQIAISGLNPHSGENGQLGTEEKDWLIPWIETQKNSHPTLQIDGPIPPDTLWVKPGLAWFGSNVKTHDAYLAMYHDQGLIPVKLMAFDRAVNTTIGLPFIRTSPDHGTAFDIAGKGVADASSMKAAIQFAIELVQQRYKIVNR